MKRRRIVVEFDEVIVKEIESRAKGFGVTITSYIKDLLLNHILSKDKVNTTEMIRQIKTNPLFWKAIRASLNRALTLNGKLDGETGVAKSANKYAEIAKTLGISEEECRKQYETSEDIKQVE